MPAYAWLDQKALETADLPAKMRALRALGVPYTDEDIAKGADSAKGKTEMDALIAYLQGLGTVLRNVR